MTGVKLIQIAIANVNLPANILGVGPITLSSHMSHHGGLKRGSVLKASMYLYIKHYF